MGWIKERILAEYRKHYRVTGGLDWALLAECKIKSQIKEIIKEAPDVDYVGEHLIKTLNLKEPTRDIMKDRYASEILNKAKGVKNEE